MANFTFNCPECDQTLEAQDEWRGQQTQCPSCGTNIEIPKIMLVKPVNIDPQEQMKKLKSALYFFWGIAIFLCLFWLNAALSQNNITIETVCCIPTIALCIPMIIAAHKKIRELKSQIDQNKHLK